MSTKDINIYIIVPIYNAEKYLNQCLESILTQTYHNFVCVMVNDGSTDSSLQICQNYTKDNRFVLISQNNKGVSAARNCGLKYVLENASENDFLSFIDADDYVEENYLMCFLVVLRKVCSHKKVFMIDEI